VEGNVIPVSINNDARLNNVQGYLKFGRYKWGYTPPLSTPADDKNGVLTDKKNDIGQDQIVNDSSGDRNNEISKNPKGLGWLKRQ